MAYETFAFVYDEVMDTSLYQRWLDFSIGHLQEKKEVLELACGTGALAVAFAKEGFNVTALDLSEEMLMIASERAQENEVNVQFVLGDMLDLAEVGSYEAVTCFSDSICYMQDEMQVQEVFDGVYQFIQSLTYIEPRIISVLTGVIDDFLFCIFFRIEFNNGI